MKRIFWLVLLLASCKYESPQEEKSISYKTDSIGKSYTELLLRRINELKTEVDNLKGDKEELQIQKRKLLAQINILQNDVLSAQGDVIKLKGIDVELTNIISVNKKILEESDRLSKQNSDLTDSNINMSDRLKNTTINLYRATSEIKKYKKAIKFQTSHESIRALGYVKKFVKGSLLRKTVLDTVSIAKQTKYIEVLFDVVGNEMLEKKEYELTIKVRGINTLSITKKKKIQYTGEAQEGISVRFDDPEAFGIGYHHADILLGEEVLYSGSIYLK